MSSLTFFSTFQYRLDVYFLWRPKNTPENFSGEKRYFMCKRLPAKIRYLFVMKAKQNVLSEQITLHWYSGRKKLERKRVSKIAFGREMSLGVLRKTRLDSFIEKIKSW